MGCICCINRVENTEKQKMCWENIGAKHTNAVETMDYGNGQVGSCVILNVLVHVVTFPATRRLVDKSVDKDDCVLIKRRVIICKLCK